MSELIEGEAQEVDALPQLAGPPRLVQERSGAGALAGPRETGAGLPAMQAAAVAAGGFVAGAAFAGLVHRRQRRRSAALSRRRRATRELPRAAGRPAARAAELVQIVGSRSLLVDVHLLGTRD
jgi:hypothetical protein